MIIITKLNGARFGADELPELRLLAIQRLGSGAAACITSLGRAYLYSAEEWRARGQRLAEMRELTKDWMR